MELLFLTVILYAFDSILSGIHVGFICPDRQCHVFDNILVKNLVTEEVGMLMLSKCKNKINKCKEKGTVRGKFK